MSKNVGETLPTVTTNKKTEPKNDCGTPVNLQGKVFRLRVQCAINVTGNASSYL